MNRRIAEVGLDRELHCARVHSAGDHMTLWLVPVVGARVDTKKVTGYSDMLCGTLHGYEHVWDVRREGRGFVIVAGRSDKSAILADRAEREKIAAAERASRWRLVTPTSLGLDTMCLVGVDGATLVPGLGPHAVLQGKMQKRSGLMTLVGAEIHAADLWVAAGLVTKQPTPDGVMISTPTVVAIRDARDGIAAAVSTTVPLPTWEKALPVLRSLLDAPNLTVQQLKAGLVELSWHDSAPQLPALVSIPLGVGARSLAEARDFYANWSIPLGVDSYGEIVTWTPRLQPHALFVASTGGGKSVLVRGVASSAILAGCAVWLGDGKATDYTALRTHPNVQMVADTTADMVVMVAALAAECRRRFAVASAAKAAGDTAAFTHFEPLLCVLDEFATVMTRVAEHDKRGADLFRADISEVLRLGRECKVHLALSTQELRADTVAGSWQENLKTLIALGQPSEQTTRYGFPADCRDAVTAAAATIPQSAKGRAIAVDPDTREVRVFQSAWQWSPGSMTLADAPSDKVRAAWAATADAMRAVTPLYPRMAVQFDSPTYRDGDIAALRALPLIPLDSRSGPIAERSHLDPASPAYTGRGAVQVSGGFGFGDDVDVVDTAPATPVHPAVSPPAPPPRVTGDKPADLQIPDDLF